MVASSSLHIQWVCYFNTFGFGFESEGKERDGKQIQASAGEVKARAPFEKDANKSPKCPLHFHPRPSSDVWPM